MKRIPPAAALAFVTACCLLFGAVAAQDTPPRPAPSAPDILRAIIAEASGELALQNEISLTGVNRNRKPEEYRTGYFESAFILEKLREYGIDEADHDRPARGGPDGLGRRVGRALDGRARAPQDRRPRRRPRLPLLRERVHGHDGRARLCRAGQPRGVLQGQGRRGQDPARQRPARDGPPDRRPEVRRRGPRRLVVEPSRVRPGPGRLERPAAGRAGPGRRSASWSPSGRARSSATPWSGAGRSSSGPSSRPRSSRTPRTS